MTNQQEAIPVTADNFIRAETDTYFNMTGNVAGALGKFNHYRQAVPIDQQTVIRSNRDTLYSPALFDLDAGPVTVTLPDAGGRYMAMQVINQDHYTIRVAYDAGPYTFTREQVGTRYLFILIRTLIDPTDPSDAARVHALQDAIHVEQKAVGSFEIPNWDHESLKKVRDALLVLSATVPGAKGMFGTKEEVDPIHHLLGTAFGWGGNPDKEATYLNVTPKQNDGKVAHRLTVKEVPVDGFWSISLYNAEGFFEPNAANVYTLNNFTAQKEADGSIIVTFAPLPAGGSALAPNTLPITPGWNYLVRLYRPRPEILDGSWHFPKAEPVG